MAWCSFLAGPSRQCISATKKNHFDVYEAASYLSNGPFQASVQRSHPGPAWPIPSLRGHFPSLREPNLGPEPPATDSGPTSILGLRDVFHAQEGLPEAYSPVWVCFLISDLDSFQILSCSSSQGADVTCSGSQGADGGLFWFPGS